MEREVPCVFWQEGDHWVARAISVEISSFGSTLEEAQSMLLEALELYFEGDAVEAVEVTDVRLQPLYVKAV